MAAISGVLMVGMLPATYAAAAPEPTVAAAEPATVERLIVQYAPKVRAWRSVDDVAGEDAVDVDLQAGRWIGFGYRTVELSEPVTEAEAEQIAADLTDAPEVLFAEPDFPVSVGVEPATSFVGPQAVQANPPWGLDRIDQRVLPLNQAYDYDNTGAGVRAYIVDTGIRSTHTQFAGRVVSGFTEFADGIGTEDCDGHGTHVAGTVGGTTYGVAKDATLVAVRVLGCDGSGTTAGVVRGLNWIAQTHPATGVPGVANLSLGPRSRSTSVSMDNAIIGVINAGVTVVVASGNSNDDACEYSPARVPEAITVNASDRNDLRTSFSNYGSCTDIYAPGSGITSAGIDSDSDQETYSGTSMAAPHVAGFAARVLQANPTFTPAQVWDRVSIASTPLRTLARDGSDADTLLFSGPPGPSAPSPPTTVTAVAGNQQATISWELPAYDGTEPISSYTAKVSNSDDSCSVVGSPPARSCTITGLNNWQSYSFTVTATNSIGTSSASVASATVRPGRVADAPTVNTVQAGAGVIDVTWIAGNEYSAPTTTYIARSSPGTRACASTGTSCTITGLTGGVEYTVTVTARNDFGDSIPSVPSIGVTPTPGIVSLPDPGTVIGWGQAASLPAGFATDITHISAGGSHLLAVTGAGQVIATGANSDGQSTVPLEAQFNATNVAAGDNHSLALVGGGVVAWGRSDSGQINVPIELSSGVSAIAAGRDHSLALKGGQIYAWGSNTYGQISLPDDSVGYSAIAAGIYHSLGLKEGKVVTWGGGFPGTQKLEIPTAVADDTIVAIAAGHTASMALSDTGRVYAWGEPTYGIAPVPAELSEGVTAIAMGDQVAFAVKNGQVYAWGSGTNGLTTVPNDADEGVEVVTGGNTVAAAIRSTPLAPTNVVPTRIDDTTVSITWDAVTRTGTPLTGYNVSYSLSDSQGVVGPLSVSVAGTTHTIDGIAVGQQVQVNVAAVNSVGAGSVATLLWPLEPAPVTNLLATAGDASVSLSWGQPVDDGGSPLTGYSYRVNGGGWLNMPTSQTTLAVSGLTNGVPVEIGVRAMNAIGGGIVTSVTRTPQAPSSGGGGGGGGGGALPPPVAPPPAEPLPPTPAPLPAPVPPGRGQAFVGDQPVNLVINPIFSGRGLDITGPDFSLVMESFDADGQPIPLDDDGSLRLQPSREFVTQGSGYLPGAQAAQYLVRTSASQTRRGAVLPGVTDDAIELGTVDIDDEGFFAAPVTIPEDVAAGDYTLQVVGTSPEGELRIINIGVRVEQGDTGETQSIMIVGTREGRSIRVDGITTGIAGQRVAPWLRLPGQRSYVQGVARRPVSVDGVFTWQRRTNKKVAVYFATENGSAQSTRVVIEPRRR